MSKPSCSRGATRSRTAMRRRAARPLHFVDSELRIEGISRRPPDESVGQSSDSVDDRGIGQLEDARSCECMIGAGDRLIFDLVRQQAGDQMPSAPAIVEEQVELPQRLNRYL